METHPWGTPRGENLEIPTSIGEKSPKKQPLVYIPEYRNKIRQQSTSNSFTGSIIRRLTIPLRCDLFQFQFPPGNPHTLHLFRPAESCPFSLFRPVTQPSQASPAATRIGFGQR